jgi:hypothetical protein
MAITRDDINDFFCDLIASPGRNILSNDGFALLADWSEQQDWWQDFFNLHVKGADWRNSYMGDPCWFALTLYNYLQRSTDK